MKTPFNYLGIEVGGNPRKKKFWEPVLNKLKSRLSVWKGRFLSMAGRICLVKSVITVVPLYYISLFKAPESVCKSIISIQRRFLWGWGKDNKPISWISWKNICKLREEGGLGIRDIRKFNVALLAKWKWRCISNEKGRWKECLESKYGTEQDGNHTPLKHQSWWWRDLVKVCRQGGGEGWFKKEVGWKIGKGDKARFWEDVWTGNASLKAFFPRLFSLSLNKGQTVGEVGLWEVSVWQWKLRWRRNRFEWEVPLETEISMLISRVTVKKDEQDKQVWRSDESGSFTAKSAYKCLEEPEGGTQISPFGCLWKTKSFPNALITAWRVLLGRLSTRECLSK